MHQTFLINYDLGEEEELCLQIKIKTVLTNRSNNGQITRTSCPKVPEGIDFKILMEDPFLKNIVLNFAFNL